jgi:hypothetical protein
MIVDMQRQAARLIPTLMSVFLTAASPAAADTGIMGPVAGTAPYGRMEQALEHHPHYGHFPVDPARSVGAPQEGYVISDADSAKNFIGSDGADPCIIVFLRRPEQKNPATGQMLPARAAVAHVDATNDPRSFDGILDRLKSAKPVEVTLVSGGLDPWAASRLIEYFRDKNVTLRTDLGRDPDSAIMDIRTGAMMPNVRMTNTPALKLDDNASTAPLVNVYDGTKPQNDFKPAGPVLPQPQ